MFTVYYYAIPTAQPVDTNVQTELVDLIFRTEMKNWTNCVYHVT